MEHFEKGVTPSDKELNGSDLRILIVHTRWNLPIVEALVKGAKETMIAKHNVLPENIVIVSALLIKLRRRRIFVLIHHNRNPFLVHMNCHLLPRH
jgi:hypothetical protein